MPEVALARAPPCVSATNQETTAGAARATVYRAPHVVPLPHSFLLTAAGKRVPAVNDEASHSPAALHRRPAFILLLASCPYRMTLLLTAAAAVLHGATRKRRAGGEPGTTDEPLACTVAPPLGTTRRVAPLALALA